MAKKADNLRRFNMYMPQEVWDWIEAKAQRTGVPASAVILMAIDQRRREEEMMAQIPVMERLVAGIRAQGLEPEG